MLQRYKHNNMHWGCWRPPIKMRFLFSWPASHAALSGKALSEFHNKLILEDLFDSFSRLYRTESWRDCSGERHCGRQSLIKLEPDRRSKNWLRHFKFKIVNIKHEYSKVVTYMFFCNKVLFYWIGKNWLLWQQPAAFFLFGLCYNETAITNT